MTDAPKIKLATTEWRDGPAVHRQMERVIEAPAIAGGERITLVWRQLRGGWSFCGVERWVSAGDPAEPRRERQHISWRANPVAASAEKRLLKSALCQGRYNARGY